MRVGRTPRGGASVGWAGASHVRLFPATGRIVRLPWGSRSVTPACRRASRTTLQLGGSRPRSSGRTSLCFQDRKSIPSREGGSSRPSRSSSMPARQSPLPSRAPRERRNATAPGRPQCGQACAVRTADGRERDRRGSSGEEGWHAGQRLDVGDDVRGGNAAAENRARYRRGQGRLPLPSSAGAPPRASRAPQQKQRARPPLGDERPKASEVVRQPFCLISVLTPPWVSGSSRSRVLSHVVGGCACSAPRRTARPLSSNDAGYVST